MFLQFLVLIVVDQILTEYAVALVCAILFFGFFWKRIQGYDPYHNYRVCKSIGMRLW